MGALNVVKSKPSAVAGVPAAWAGTWMGSDGGVDRTIERLQWCSALVKMAMDHVSEEHLNAVGADQRCSFEQLCHSLRFTRTLLIEAEECAADAPDDVRQHVVQAAAICRLVVGDFAVEYDGNLGQHWNSEISHAALWALDEVIARASAAVKACVEEMSRGK